MTATFNINKEPERMEFKDYSKYMRFACDEELERTLESINAILDPDTDWGPGGDKHWLPYPSGEGLPDIEHVTKMVKNRDMAADFAIIDDDIDNDDARDDLYEELRTLFLWV